MSAFYTIEMMEVELLAMLMGKPTTVYAEHDGYVAPAMVLLSAQEIDDLLDNTASEQRVLLEGEMLQTLIEEADYYVGQCAMCGEPLSKRIYKHDDTICNSCLSTLIGE